MIETTTRYSDKLITLNIDGEDVHMKKDGLGWRIIYPHRNTDGSPNWTNRLIGGKRNFITVFFLVLLIVVLQLSHYHDVQAIENRYIQISADPVAYCKQISVSPVQAGTQIPTFTNITTIP